MGPCDSLTTKTALSGVSRLTGVVWQQAGPGRVRGRQTDRREERGGGMEKERVRRRVRKRARERCGVMTLIKVARIDLPGEGEKNREKDGEKKM